MTDESTSAADAAAEAAEDRSTDAPAGKSAADTGGEAPEADDDHRELTDEERAELYKQQLKELRVLDVARDMMLTVVTVGYQKLGLTDDTRELRNLDDAHLAIELLRAVVEVVDGVADADEVETYRSTLAQMQLNYAKAAAS